MKKAAKLALFAGIVLMVVPVPAVMAYSFVQTARMFDPYGPGISDPRATTSQIAFMLTTTASAIMFSLGGVLLAALSGLWLFLIKVPQPAKSPGVTGPQ